MNSYEEILYFVFFRQKLAPWAAILEFLYTKIVMYQAEDILIHYVKYENDSMNSYGEISNFVIFNQKLAPRAAILEFFIQQNSSCIMLRTSLFIMQNMKMLL